MSLEKELQKRSDSKCELCTTESDLKAFQIPPNPNGSADQAIHVCATCFEQLEDPEKTDPNHWRCLNDSMWSPVPAVQVVTWRMLNRLKTETWPIDLLDMMYMEDETAEWAKATGEGQSTEDAVVHKDSNGNILQSGDTVVLINTLNVKGSTVTAKRGAAVRNISLVWDNPEHIEGRVEGQQVVILTKFVKKA